MKGVRFLLDIKHILIKDVTNVSRQKVDAV